MNRYVVYYKYNSLRKQIFVIWLRVTKRINEQDIVKVVTGSKGVEYYPAEPV